MQQVEEHRRSAERHQGLAATVPVQAFEPGQEQQADSQGEGEEQQRRRILGDVEEAHQGDRRRLAEGPGFLAIAVEQAQQDEAEQQPATARQEVASARGRRRGAAEPVACGIAQGDHTDPRQQGVGGAQAQGVARFDPAAIVEHRPRQVPGRAGSEMQRIEQVVAGHQQHAERREQRARQPEQGGQGEHAQADRPDHLEIDHRRRQLEGPGEVHQGQFQRHQEQPALEQERRDRPASLALLAVEECRQAGEEDEHRRAQVRQGAAEEQRWLGAGDVHRVADLAVQEKGLADMVEQHEQHHQAAQGVDAVQAGGIGDGVGHGWAGRRKRGMSITAWRREAR